MPKRSFPEHRSLGAARAVLRVLTFMAEYPEGVDVKEVARYLGKSTHTAYYLLNSLWQEGFAEHVPSLHKYRLTGDRVCRGPHQTRQVDHFLDKVLDDLYLATHCRSYLWIYDGQHTLLERMRGRQGQPTVVNVGHEMHNEAHATAAGKAVFAYAPPGVVANYIHSVGLQPFTPNTITDPVCLGNELEKVRCEGLAFSRGEYVESVFGIAFALKFCREGHAVIAALAATVPRQRFVEQEGELVRLVRGVAMRASRALSC